MERCIREEEISLGFYVANFEEKLIRAVLAAETINTRETITSVEFKKQKSKRTKRKVELKTNTRATHKGNGGES